MDKKLIESLYKKSQELETLEAWCLREYRQGNMSLETLLGWAKMKSWGWAAFVQVFKEAAERNKPFPPELESFVCLVFSGEISPPVKGKNDDERNRIRWFVRELCECGYSQTRAFKLAGQVFHKSPPGVRTDCGDKVRDRS